MIKTRICSCLSDCSVAQLMRISIEGPEIDAAEFEEILEIYLSFLNEMSKISGGEGGGESQPRRGGNLRVPPFVYIPNHHCDCPHPFPITQQNIYINK